jgi:outer membrane biosynthesis protein TonB
MLSKPELRKLIKAHNVLSKITIPKGASLDDMVKMVEKAGYKVNHEKKRLDVKVKRGKQITLKQAEEITAPKPKTALQKQKAQEKKEEKAIEQKKKEREIRKKAVAEEKKRQKPKPKTATIETQTETPKKQEKVVRIDQIKVGDTIRGDRSKTQLNKNIPIPTQKGVVVRVNKSGSVKIKFGSDGDEVLVYAPFRMVEKKL